jgi:hypothetical protein
MTGHQPTTDTGAFVFIFGAALTFGLAAYNAVEGEALAAGGCVAIGTLMLLLLAWSVVKDLR